MIHSQSNSIESSRRECFFDCFRIDERSIKNGFNSVFFLEDWNLIFSLVFAEYKYILTFEIMIIQGNKIPNTSILAMYFMKKTTRAYFLKERNMF